MAEITPFNLARSEFGGTYTDLSPRQAVIAAHAQERGDFNTWDYERTYGPSVIEFADRGRGLFFATLGDWTASADSPAGHVCAWPV